MVTRQPTLRAYYNIGMARLLREEVGGNGGIDHIHPSQSVDGLTPLRLTFDVRARPSGRKTGVDAVTIRPPRYLLASLRGLAERGHFTLEERDRIEELKEQERSTPRSMDDYFIAQGWSKRTRSGAVIATRAKWGEPGSEAALSRQLDAFRHYVEWVRKIDPSDKRELGAITQIQMRADGSRLAFLANVHGMHRLIAMAYPEVGIKEWEMGNTPPGFWLSAENRRRATLTVVEEAGKLDAPFSVTKKDFKARGADGMLNHYNKGILAALKEAGLVPPEKEEEWQRMISSRFAAGDPGE